MIQLIIIFINLKILIVEYHEKLKNQEILVGSFN